MNCCGDEMQYDSEWEIYHCAMCGDTQEIDEID